MHFLAAGAIPAADWRNSLGMRSGTTFKKRQKEIARMEKQRDKFARRMQRKLEKAAGHPVDDMGQPAGELSAPQDELGRQAGA